MGMEYLSLVAKTVERSGREHFASALKKIDALEAPGWLKDLRRSGADRFGSTEFPNYKQEAWRFTNVTPIVQTPFTSRVAKSPPTLEPEAVASLAPMELARLGISPGEQIEVATRRGRISLKARADTGIPKGVVFVRFCSAEAAANMLTPPALDPFG